MQTPSAPSPVRILGIDPGSRITGYGVIELAGLVPRYVASGCIRTADGALEQRLAQIYAGLSEVVGLHRPNAVAIERVFMAKNPDSALKLGQARGAALVCMANHGLAIEEYAARQIKQAVTGQGAPTSCRYSIWSRPSCSLRPPPGRRGRRLGDCADPRVRQSISYGVINPGGGRRRSSGRWRLS